MKGQRIIFTVTNDLTYDRRMFRICTALAEAEADVTLVGRQLDNSLSFHPGIFQANRIKCFFNKGFLFYKEYNLRLFFFLLFKPFDIACACDLDTALPVRLAAGMKAKKTVYDAHEFFTEVPEVTERKVVKWIWNLIGNLTIPGFDLRYTVGEELASLMGKKYNTVFHVIRNIPSETQISAETKALRRKHPEKKVLFYQGALNVGRGLEVLLEAMRRLPDWDLWLAGEGDITGKLKMLSKQYGIDDRVRFFGWVYSQDLPDLMAQARLGINLREKGSLNDYYSLPNKFFDFIHAGLPSINMNYPEYANVCAHYQVSKLIDHATADVIVETVEWFDRHPEAYDKMMMACHDAAMELSWVHESNKLVTLWNEVILS